MSDDASPLTVATVALTGLERGASASPMRFGSARRLRKAMSRPLLNVSAKLLVSAALIWLVCRNISPGGIALRFIGQSPAWVIVAAATTLAQVAVAALRWQQILRALGIEMPDRTVLSVTYIGSFFNSWLLGNGSGDLARAILAPPNESGRAAIVHSVLFDRAVALAGVGLTILPIVLLDVGPLGRRAPVLLSLAVTVLPFLGMWFLEAVSGPAVRRGMPFARVAAALVISWQRLRRTWRRFAMSLALAAASELVFTVTAYSLARAQHLDVSFLDFVTLIPPVVLLGALPISLGGWGVRENVLVMALAPIGIAAGPALLVGVQIGLLGALMSLPGGAIWLFGHFSRRAVAEQQAQPT